jgi:BON domain/Pentapeptide repeats (8 copies)
MTSVTHRHSKLKIALLSSAFILAGASSAFAQAQGNASPFGYTARLQTAGFANTGFQNAGFRNTGFRNTGFQNTGFRNTAISNTGIGNYAGQGGVNIPSNSIGPNGYGATAPTTAATTSYSSPLPQYGVGLDTRSLTAPNPGYAPDDSAAITVGPGTNLTSGYSMPAISRGARFTLGLGFDSPVGTTNPRLSAELQGQFANSQRFSSGKNISVAVENNVVVLRGKVADTHERDLAEMFVRLSPGVYDVRNELQVGDDVATAKK